MDNERLAPVVIQPTILQNTLLYTRWRLYSDLRIVLKDLFNHRPEILRAAIACLLLAVCALLIPAADNPLQRWIGDLAQRQATPEPINGKVVLIAIDEASQTRLGPWPWPNSRHAVLINQLRSNNVRAIAFATPLMPQSQPAEATGSTANPDGNQLLARAMREHGQVVIPVEVSAHEGAESGRDLVAYLTRAQRHFGGDSLEQAIASRPLDGNGNALMSAAAALGHLVVPEDPDGTTRREYAAIRLGSQALPALSVALANMASEQRNSLVVTDEQLQLAPDMHSTSLGDALDFIPKFAGNAVSTLSYWQILEGKFDPRSLNDTAVVIGFTEGAGADRIQTPIGALPRAMVVAMHSNALLTESTYQHPAWATLLEWLLALTVIVLAATAFLKFRLLINAALVVLIVSVTLLVAYLLMNRGTTLLQVIPQLTALIGSLMLSAALNKQPVAHKQGTGGPAISMDTLKTLALTLHGQGQLDLAFETLRRCQPNRDTLDLLYRLAADYERRREVLKAAQTYRYVGEIDQSYKDASEKARQLQQEIERPKPATAAAAMPTPLTNISRPKPSVPAPTPNPNRESLGRYEIDRQIGKGAMGVVYLGRDPKINRIVAIKAIPLADEFQDQDLLEARERFFREAEMAGRLNHPGIVTIFDAGEDRGLAYIAMEYIQGEHLSYYCEPNRLLPIRKVLTLVIRVAEALNYAHLQNVVHRDIKPANIMFNIETDALKITDFGIARLSDVSRTKTGIVLGTPSFMSPEQLEGRPLDGRSDLFGLGVSLYQMLTGQLPFRADSMTRLMNNIATEPHPPIRSLRPELPECMEQVIDRCLAKAADDRYQNGIDLADAIRNCMRGLT